MHRLGDVPSFSRGTRGMLSSDTWSTWRHALSSPRLASGRGSRRTPSDDRTGRYAAPVERRALLHSSCRGTQSSALADANHTGSDNNRTTGSERYGRCCCCLPLSHHPHLSILDLQWNVFEGDIRSPVQFRGVGHSITPRSGVISLRGGLDYSSSSHSRSCLFSLHRVELDRDSTQTPHFHISHHGGQGRQGQQHLTKVEADGAADWQ